MFDKIVFADEVSALLKGKYAHEKAAAFDHSFNEVANIYKVDGHDRATLKSEIGKLLSKRPRTYKGKPSQNVLPQKTAFEVIEYDEHLFVVFKTKERCPTTLKFERNGTAVLWTRWEGAVGMNLLRDARLFAEDFFAACDHKRSRTAIVTLGSSDEHILLRLNGQYEACFRRGKRGLVASVTRGDAHCTHKEVPAELMQSARGIAMQHFKNTGTLPLRFA